MKKYYITTPIYYPSGKWHIGTCYTTVVCDALARFKRMQGFDVFYLTGTDEHGMKIEKAANDAGMSPKAYVDKQSASLVELWKLLGISYDKFIRTTDGYHKAAVQKIVARLFEQGDIYKSAYEGWYCTPCESFWTKTQLVDGNCPDCGRPVDLTKETSYFFRLSAYRERLIALIEGDKEFLQPTSRQNEMLNNFLRTELKDLCVSRTTFKWGIEVPFDAEHVVYVWVDALSNYITALGYGSEDDSLFKKFWPADLHMMGKEIVRFHSIIWPALLMALDIPLPKKVYGHGWLLLDGGKISKSKGNIIDPVVLSARYSVDAVRYFLLREVPFGQDGVYTNRALLSRINTDLCNSLGNLVSRTAAMVGQYFGGKLPAPAAKTEFDADLVSIANGVFGTVTECMDKLLVPEALAEIFRLVQRANKYIDETAPWVLAKDAAKRLALATVLYNLTEAIRLSAVMLSPFLIDTPAKILASLGLSVPEKFGKNVTFGRLKGGETISQTDKLFPRIDVEKELAAMDSLVDEPTAAAVSAAHAADAAKHSAAKPEAHIQYADFACVSLKAGVVLEAERVAKSEKLLKLKVDTGTEVRVIVSGIAKHYSPEAMVGKRVTVVANLAPAKLCGILSEGMLLCADGADGGIVLVSPEAAVPAGSKIC